MIAALAFFRQYGYLIGVALLLTGAALWVKGYGDRRCDECRNAVVAEYQRQLNEANARAAAAEQRSREVSANAERRALERERELQARVNDIVSRREPVRLCKPAAGGVAPAGVPDAAGDPGNAAPVDRHDLQAGRDIGDDLVRYAGECEGLRRHVIGLQEWIEDQREAFHTHDTEPTRKGRR